MKTLVVQWELYQGVEKPWEQREIKIHGGLTPFEVLSMAAGLRAENRRIRNVHVYEETEQRRELH
jgi:hypothetical protein